MRKGSSKGAASRLAGEGSSDAVKTWPSRMLSIVMALALIVFCFVALVGPEVPAAEASVVTEAADDLVDNALPLIVGSAVETTVWLAQAVTDADAPNLIYVSGDKTTNTALGTQSKFGSFQGSPFLFNAGLLTQEPAKGRLVFGIGSSVGSMNEAKVNLYLELGPDDLSSYNLRSVRLRNWAVVPAAGP